MVNQRIVIDGEEWELNSWFKVRDSEYLSANFKPVPKPKPDPFAEGQKLTMEPFAKVDRLIMGLTGIHSDDRFLLKQVARAIVEVCKKEK